MLGKALRVAVVLVEPLVEPLAFAFVHEEADHLVDQPFRPRALGRELLINAGERMADYVEQPLLDLDRRGDLCGDILFA